MLTGNLEIGKPALSICVMFCPRPEELVGHAYDLTPFGVQQIVCIAIANRCKLIKFENYVQILGLLTSFEYFNSLIALSLILIGCSSVNISS